MKVACIQMNSGNDMAANIEMFQRRVEEAVAAGAALVATPENTFFMDSWAPDDLQKSTARFTQDMHPGVAAASEVARKHGVWVLVGGVAILPDQTPQQVRGDKTFNRSLLFDPQGGIAASYDKVHLFDVNVGDGQSYVESARYLAGEKPVVASAGAVKLGLSICYDVRFPYLYRKLAMEGAEVLTVPAAFVQLTGEAHWHILLRARAIENGCFVIAPAQCGTHPGGRKTFGHSLIVDPWGRVLADGGTEEGVVMAEIDLAEVQKVRAKIPSLAHCRSALFTDYSI